MSEPIHDPLSKAHDEGHRIEVKNTTCYMCACRCGIRVTLRDGEVRYMVCDDQQCLPEDQVAFDTSLEIVGEAASGDEAVGQVKALAPDVLLLDLEMPGVDGFDVLRGLRERGIETPVIVYTGTGNYDRCVQAIRLGAFSFIDKP